MSAFNIYRRGKDHNKEIHVFEGPRWLVSFYCEIGVLDGKFFYAVKQNSREGETTVVFECGLRKRTLACSRGSRELFEYANKLWREDYFSLAL